MATLDIGGAGNAGRDQSFARSLLAQQDARYRGFTQQALANQWIPTIDPIQQMLDDARRREELLRAQNAARAAALTPPVLQDFLTNGLFANGRNAPTQGPGLLAEPDRPVPGIPHGADPATMSIADRAEFLGLNPATGGGRADVTPHWTPPADPTADMGNESGGGSSGTGMGVSPDSKTPPGSGPVDVSQLPSSKYQARTAQQIVEDALAQFPGVRANIQANTYGQPTPVTDPDGETRLVFPTDDLKYYGIDENLQREGYIPVFRPNDLVDGPGPDATDAEKREYALRLQTALRPPEYKIGDSAQYIFNLDRSEKIDLQRRLKAAGTAFYDSGTMIAPGIFDAADVEAVQRAMGYANQTGLSLDDAIALAGRKYQRFLAEKKAAGSGGGGSGPLTHTVQITYSPTSMAQGRSLLAGVLADALGRAPSDSELSAFMARLNAAENKSPVRTVTNYVRSGSSQTSTSRTTPSKVDPEAMAREFATEINGGDEFFDYQANSYLDGLMSMLMGAANGA